MMPTNFILFSKFLITIFRSFWGYIIFCIAPVAVILACWATPSPKFRVEKAVSPSGIIQAARSERVQAFKAPSRCMRLPVRRMCSAGRRPWCFALSDGGEVNRPVCMHYIEEQQNIKANEVEHSSRNALSMRVSTSPKNFPIWGATKTPCLGRNRQHSRNLLHKMVAHHPMGDNQRQTQRFYRGRRYRRGQLVNQNLLDSSPFRDLVNACMLHGGINRLGHWCLYERHRLGRPTVIHVSRTWMSSALPELVDIWVASAHRGRGVTPRRWGCKSEIRKHSYALLFIPVSAGGTPSHHQGDGQGLKSFITSGARASPHLVAILRRRRWRRGRPRP